MKPVIARIRLIYADPLYRFLTNLALVVCLVGLWWLVDGWISGQAIWGRGTSVREVGVGVFAVIMLSLLGYEALANFKHRNFWLVQGGIFLMLVVLAAAIFFVILLETFRNFNLDGLNY